MPIWSIILYHKPHFIKIYIFSDATKNANTKAAFSVSLDGNVTQAYGGRKRPFSDTVSKKLKQLANKRAKLDATQKSQKKCEGCKKTRPENYLTDKDNPWVTCTVCPQNAHMRCCGLELVIGLSKPSSLNWRCSKHSKAKNVKKSKN